MSRRSLIVQEFIFQRAPFAGCHASTIAWTRSGLKAAWFAGTDEGEKDVGIWFSRNDGRGWTPPVEVANGMMNSDERHPCWNPVLFEPTGKPLLLFYKVGPNPREWWGVIKSSADGGSTWSGARRLPDGILGPVKNKPVRLPNGDLLCGSSTEQDGWKVHMETTRDVGKNWKATKALNDPNEFGAIQPAILAWTPKRIQILCRSRQQKITQCWSQDGGKTWGKMTATQLVNPNAGIDAVMLKDGRALLVYNDTPQGRTPLSVAVSRDGNRWTKVLDLVTEPGEYSYPAIIQKPDGRVHITYTWRRNKVRHAMIDPLEITSG